MGRQVREGIKTAKYILTSLTITKKHFLEVKLPYELGSLSVGRSVVGLSVLISSKGAKFRFHVPIEVLVYAKAHDDQNT